MIAGWLVYCIAVSALLAGSAAALDAVLTRRGRPARWVWVIAIVGAMIVPAGVYVGQLRAAAPQHGLDETRVGGVAGRFPSYVLDNPAPNQSVAIPRARIPEWLGADRIVVAIAIACVLLASIRIAADSWMLYRGRRSWTAHVIGDTNVLVSDDMGPAIVGFIKPRIVLPRWVLALDADDRDLMLAHEREHLHAGDTRVTTLALLMVAAMPWNVVAWYSWRRLRTAIEVDCDRRVLRRFPDVRRYGHLLVDVAQRATGSSLAVAGFSERAAPLARRIHAMTLRKDRHGIVDAGRVALAGATFAGAFLILPPTPPAKATFSQFSDIPVAAQQTADSIATFSANHLGTLVGAAHDLPRRFAIANPDATELRDGECPTELRDDRDGTVLRRSVAHTATTGSVSRGDTTWTRQRAVGFYMVRPVGRYGVAEGQRLRIACGGKTIVKVAGHKAPSSAISTLESPTDDRARRIADAVTPLAHARPIAVDLTVGRLDVVFGDTTVARDDDVAWDLRRQIARKSGEVLGYAALPETVTVSYRTGRDAWRTLVYYKSADK